MKLIIKPVYKNIETSQAKSTVIINQLLLLQTHTTVQ